MQERAEGTATPSDSNSDAQKEGAQRAPVQSPVGASAAGEKAKTVFSSIISPVLTLFQGKQEEKQEEPTVVLEVRRSEKCPPFPVKSLWRICALCIDLYGPCHHCLYAAWRCQQWIHHTPIVLVQLSTRIACRAAESAMQDGQRAHVGPHRCDGGPEPSPGQHKGQPQQVEGMPMPSQQGQAAGHTDEPASSTSGESHTCVGNGGVPG